MFFDELDVHNVLIVHFNLVIDKKIRVSFFVIFPLDKGYLSIKITNIKIGAIPVNGE